MTSTPRYLAVTTVAGLLIACAACAGPQQAPGPSAGTPSPANTSTEPGHAVVTGTFAADGTAVNYDKTLVPDRAGVLVAENVFEGATTVTLSVRGLTPNRAYGAHAHAKPCGPKGDDAGPHFQNMADPVKPSVDPAFANAGNEIWLDFTTDVHGNATSASTVPWLFTNARASSVVIHANPTQTAPGKAGTAGARIGCVSVAF